MQLLKTSIYHVKAKGEYCASAVKIALKGTSKILIGEDIAEGGMIAIYHGRLQGYIPEKYGFTSPLTGYERAVERINIRYWRGCSLAIIALFFDETEARKCFDDENHRPNDSRWAESTKRVLEAMGHDHPSFYISTNPRYSPVVCEETA